MLLRCNHHPARSLAGPIHGSSCGAPVRAARQTVRAVAVAMVERPRSTSPEESANQAMAGTSDRFGSGGRDGAVGKKVSKRTDGLIRPQVFISHTNSDKDAGTFAASILKPALQAAGLPVFIDYESLKAGRSWQEELEAAATYSKVFVAVLSRSYVRKFWCMRELHFACKAHAEETGIEIIPVFYDDVKAVVQPDHIRRLWREGGDLFKGKRSCRQRVINAAEWAKNIASMEENIHNIRRWSDVQAPKDRDRQLAFQVVEACVRHLPPQVPVVDDVVGYKQQLQEIAAELGSGHDNRLGVWLYGCGGMGKTVMAELLFNNLIAGHDIIKRRDFQCHAYIKLGMEISPTDLQLKKKEILDQFYAYINPGRQQHLQEFVKEHKVLLLLDNVSDALQLDALLPRQFKEGSIIIVTSRNKDLNMSSALSKVRPAGLGRQFHKHQMQGLAAGHAKEMLCYWAELSADTMQYYDLEQEVDGMAEACSSKSSPSALPQALPLALKVMGAALVGEYDKAEWKRARIQLEIGVTASEGGEKLPNLLRYSFDTLKEAEKNMFLDVATVLCNQPLSLALAVWQQLYPDESAKCCLKTLERRCLLECEGDVLHMHDVLKYLARGVVRGSRDVVDKDTADAFGGSRVFVSLATNGQPHALEVFGRRTVGNTKRTPVEERSPIAVQLDADGAFSKDSSATMQPFPAQPKTMDLSETRVLRLGRVRPASLAECPPSKVLFSDIVCEDGVRPVPPIHDVNCEQLTLLADIQVVKGELACPIASYWGLGRNSHPELLLQQLPAVSILQLHVGDPAAMGCITDWLQQQTQLVELELHHPSTTFVLADLAELTSLSKLSFSGSSNMSELLLPKPGSLLRLKHLDLSSCAAFSKLPTWLCSFHGLEILNLSDCSGLANLPDAFGSLVGLRSLDLSGCSSLAQVPASFEGLQLKEVCIEGCHPSAQEAVLAAYRQILRPRAKMRLGK